MKSLQYTVYSLFFVNWTLNVMLVVLCDDCLSYHINHLVLPCYHSMPDQLLHLLYLLSILQESSFQFMYPIGKTKLDEFLYDLLCSVQF